MNKIPQYLRLKDNHPTIIKLNKLTDLAEKLGLCISFYNHRCLLEDRDRDKNLPSLYIEDIEGGFSNVNSFPNEMEYKVTYENPAYLAEEKRIYEEAMKLQKIKEAEKLALEEKSKKERRAQQLIRDVAETERKLELLKQQQILDK